MSVHSRCAVRVTICCLAALVVCDPGQRPASAGLLDGGFTRNQLDLPNCVSVSGGQEHVIDEFDLLGVLGFESRPSNHRWKSGQMRPAVETGETYQYRVAFRKPVKIGSLWLWSEAETISYLKPTAKYPGDPADESQWVKLAFPPAQSGARYVTLPKVVETRAVLVTDRRTQGWSSIRGLRISPARMHNITPDAWAYASQEYTPPNSKFTYSASLITSGAGYWENTGKDNQGRISSPPINDLNPVWFMTAWPTPQTISGLWLEDNFQQIELEQFVGPSDLNPRVGTPKEWRKIKEFKQDEIHGRWIAFDPVTTRGLRIRILKSAKEDPAIARIWGLHVFSDLADRPVPPPQSRGAEQQAAPTQIPLELAGDASLTIAIEGPDGRRARNLIAREPETAGQLQIPWDLRDELGNYVAPGTYRWKALAHAPFELKYVATVYPNVEMHAPENAPWLTGVSGSGGWLADHTPPVGCCAIGDRVFLSAYVAESGVSLIECDLAGRKRWGHHSFAAWTGPRYLASDGKTLFVGSQIMNSDTDGIWSVDLESKKVDEYLKLLPTASRKRGMQGMAARPGELAISIQAKENWLANAATADDVDSNNCLPLYGEKRKPRVAYEIVPDPRKDFLRLFRLVEHPSGGETSFTLTYLQTMKSSSPQQHIVLAFHKPVPIGSVVFPVPQLKDMKVKLSVLKPDAPYPPQPEKAAHWKAFDEHGSHPWDVVPAPEGTVTRALRITFAKGDAGDEDSFAKLLDAPKGDDEGGLDIEAADKKKSSKLVEFGEDTSRWLGQLEGLKILRRRFVSRFPEAEVRVSSGLLDQATGEWDALRERPLSESDPGIYLMEWAEPQKIRGLAIKEIDGKLTKIDVFTGKGPVILDGVEGWQEMAEYEQQRRDVGNGYGLGFMNPQARYVDGYVDFGKEVHTRAVRLRIVEQWADNGQAACMGIRIDRGGRDLDAKRCRVWGVAPMEYVGGEPAIESAANDRIEFYATAGGKLIKEAAVPKPAEIAYAPDGNLYALSDNTVVRVNPGQSSHNVIVSDLKAPTDLAFDKQGQLYVFDGQAERHQVRVYDKSGKFLRTIGTAGGFRAGPWDPTRLGTVTSIDVDQENQLWVVENQYWPKRVSVWSTDGTFRKELLGNTSYGGGGVLDPEDLTRIFYGPLEFKLDWKTGQSYLKNMTWLPGWNAGEVPLRIGGRTYLVTRPQFSEMPVGYVYLYEKDHLKLAAAVGQAVAFDPIKQPEVWSKFGNRTLTDQLFTWSDLNGDGEVQADEVTLFPRPAHVHGVSRFNRDLSIQSQSVRYKVKEYLPSGVPVYEVLDLPELTSRTLYRLDGGNFYRMGDDPKFPEAVLDAKGNAIWTYPHEGSGVQAAGSAKARTPGQVVSQFGIVGHETAAKGDLGEFVVIHTNTGQWNVWTADGLLVGPIFRDLRDPKIRPWSMPEHERGMLMKNMTSGQEHFCGYFCRAKDGKYYVIAGHNHVSVAEVLGIDAVKRYEGTLEVTTDKLQATQEWEQSQQRVEVFARAPVVDCYRAKEPPVLDGDLKDWKVASARLDEGQGSTADFSMSYDDQNLYLAYGVRGLGPLKNSGTQWDRLFKTGASVDLQIAVDPAAEPEDRMAPVEGDIRLLLTYTGDQPRAVLYQPVAPDAAPSEAWRVVSPVNELTFDRVKELEGVQFARGGMNDLYVIEAAIPLELLGLKPEAGLRLKFDWGVLSTGPDGTEVLRRIYWANKATSVVADAPSEARLTPHLWGHVRFHGDRPSSEDQLDDFDVTNKPKSGKAVKKDVNDLLDDLETKKK